MATNLLLEAPTLAQRATGDKAGGVAFRIRMRKGYCVKVQRLLPERGEVWLHRIKEVEREYVPSMIPLRPAGGVSRP